MKNPWFACLIILALPAIVAASEKCTSITDRYCNDAPLIIAHGATVTVQTEASGESFYNLKDHKLSEEDYTFSCPGSKCSCKANVKYLHFEEKSSAIAQINAKEEQEAKKKQCSFENASILRRPDFVYTSPNLISTAIFNLEYCRGCSGGCNGHTNLITYDVATGQKYVLGDLIALSQLANLQDDLREEFLKRYVSKEQLDYVNKFLLQDIIFNVKMDSNFYVENGVIYVNIDSFSLSCANGSFYPVPIPIKYIQPTFLKLVGINN